MFLREIVCRWRLRQWRGRLGEVKEEMGWEVPSMPEACVIAVIVGVGVKRRWTVG
jgi:hypothetical protein